MSTTRLRARNPLHHHRRVRQLVAMRALRREVGREQARHRLDALDHAGLEVRLAKLRFHAAADRLPAGLTDPRINAAVGDDLDLAIGEQQINQHAIIVLGVPDPQLREDVERALPGGLVAEQGRAVERALDDEADLARMRGLAGPDRLLDAVKHLSREDAARAPMVLDQMPGDALNAHERTASHQLPEAPPPPKLPPPPEKPLSLELEPELQPLLLPPEKPPDQPLPRPRPDCRPAF